MDRLSPLDAAFLEAEDADSHVSMAIASVGVFDGTPPTLDELNDALTSRLPLLPRYRQRVWRAPLDVVAPRWVEDPRFDIRFHVRRTAVPAPGRDDELFALIARIMTQRLDRDRPLWETWLVEGLAGGHWALVSKVHHCMVDGVAGTELYHLLLSPSPDVSPPPPTLVDAADGHRGNVLASVAAEMTALPLRQARLLTTAVRRPRASLHALTTTTRGLLAMSHVFLPSAPSTLQGGVGQERRYAATVVPLSDVKDISHRFGVTINDVALAAATGGFRALLSHRGEPCGRHAVRSLVPVSVRLPGDEGSLANKVSCMFADLPVHLDDPLARLRDVHAQLLAAKKHGEAEAGAMLTELVALQPFGVVSPMLRNAFRLPQRSLVTVTTNVPGPREPLYLLGRKMVRMFPYVPIADRVRIGLAILSYCDEIAFGVTADYDSGTDIDQLLAGIRADLDALAATRPRAERRECRL